MNIEGPDGAIVEVRSSTSAPSGEEKRFDANSLIVFRVTWDRAKSGDEVDISIFEAGEDGALRRLEHAKADAVPLGGIRLTVPAGANFGSRPRDVVLYLAVMPGSSPPAIAGLTPEEAARRRSGAQLKTFRLRYEGRTDP